MADHTRCRICGAALPPAFLDLGAMPLANAFPRSPDEFAREERFPLAVTGCPTCGLVQLDHVVPAERLYREYIYVSSTSDAVREHAERLAARLITRFGWGDRDLVVEVASNDGTVLKAFQRRGTRVLGVEPARNIAAAAERDGVPTVAEFFDSATAVALSDRHAAAAAIIGRHVFAHVDDVHDFLQGVDALLDKDGLLLIEVPYLGDLIANLEFDTIYHEHLSYFSLLPVVRLCEARGFRLVDVERVPLHGGSVLLYITRAHAASRSSDELAALLRDEHERGLATPEVWTGFAARVRRWRAEAEEFIEELRRSGADVIGYGAAAKANTLLNYCPAVSKVLRYILDRSPLKHGRYTPGTHIPVQPVDRWRSDSATHLLILAWNFADEIVRQMRPFAERGGRFIVPIPEPRVL
jgi:novobiocin biosynthesis protein NovU/D-mycarose 3-C-methyltransferase